jgi:serine/threonine-protein kinase RsbW
LTQIRIKRKTSSKAGMGERIPLPAQSIENGRKNPVIAPLPGRRSFELSSTMESVCEIEAVAEKMAEEAGLDDDERFRVTMAVREAAVNAVLHGNEYDPGRKIAVGFENTGKSLVFTIADQGKGFIPEEVPDPLGWRRRT